MKDERELRRRYKRALALLSEAPAECERNFPVRPSCGRCWTCRIWAFLAKAANPLTVRA